MATPLPMPKLGLTMEEGTILKWLKSEGEKVEKGEIILQIQTDKVEYDVEAPDTGLLLRTFAGEGDVVPCGDNIAVIGNKGEDISEFESAGAPAASPGGAAAAPQAPAPVAPVPSAPAPQAPAPQAEDSAAVAVGATVKRSGSWLWARFPARPAAEVREQMKAAGWRWSGRRGAWYLKPAQVAA